MSLALSFIAGMFFITAGQLSKTEREGAAGIGYILSLSLLGLAVYVEVMVP